MTNTAIKKSVDAILTNNWKIVDDFFPYKLSMMNCIQDQVHHAEGDVWTHTRMVFDQVLGDNLSNSHKLAALYHDVAKPQTRTEEIKSDRTHISHPNHSRIGAQILWKDLWINDIGDLELKLKSYWLVRWHQRIFHTWTQSDMLRSALGCHVDIDLLDLINFAKCDSLGRICDNQQDTICDLELLNEWAVSNKIHTLLPTNYSRLFFFEKSNRSAYYSPVDPVGSKAVLMCGLPGSGKDTLISTKYNGYNIISLDGIRSKLGLEHRDNQGIVIQLAIEQAKENLRQSKPFVWNATNLTKQIRSKIINLFRDYDAEVTIEVVATKFSDCIKRNEKRKEPVPYKAIEHMLDKWEPPSLTEAHNIHWNI